LKVLENMEKVQKKLQQFEKQKKEEKTKKSVFWLTKAGGFYCSDMNRREGKLKRGCEKESRLRKRPAQKGGGSVPLFHRTPVQQGAERKKLG